jgi:hypothetical protein
MLSDATVVLELTVSGDCTGFGVLECNYPAWVRTDCLPPEGFSV